MKNPDIQVHRGTYILERGTWRAVCRVCGWNVTDGNRRRAAAIFRQHLQDQLELERAQTVTGLGGESVAIDLRDAVPASAVAVGAPTAF